MRFLACWSFSLLKTSVIYIEYIVLLYPLGYIRTSYFSNLNDYSWLFCLKNRRAEYFLLVLKKQSLDDKRFGSSIDFNF